MSTPLGHQVILRFEDDRVIAPSAVARRAVAAGLAALGEAFGLFAWACADDHLHAGLFADLEVAREFGRRLRISLQRRLQPGVSFRLPRITPIHDQAHARSVLFYAVRQAEHHASDQDPWQECNCIHDILSTRHGASWFPARVREHFPRVTRAELLARIGLDAFDEVSGFDADAAAAAYLLPHLRGRSDRVVAARAAAIAAAAGVDSRVLAAGLDMDPRSVRRLRSVRVSPVDVRVMRRQLGLRQAIIAARAAACASPAPETPAASATGAPANGVRKSAPAAYGDAR